MIRILTEIPDGSEGDRPDDRSEFEQLAGAFRPHVHDLWRDSELIRIAHRAERLEPTSIEAELTSAIDEVTERMDEIRLEVQIGLGRWPPT